MSVSATSNVHEIDGTRYVNFNSEEFRRTTGALKFLHTMADMGTEIMKKRRAFNFTHDELEALVVAVEERKAELFGKFTPTLTAQIKEKKWQEATEAVSAVRGVQRTVDSIKKKWSTIASDAKTRGVLQKRDQAKTGAGVTEVKPLTSLEEKILAVMGQVYTEGKLRSMLADVNQQAELAWQLWLICLNELRLARTPPLRLDW